MIKLDKEACVIGKSVLCGIVLGSAVYLVITLCLWIVEELS